MKVAGSLNYQVLSDGTDLEFFYKEDTQYCFLFGEDILSYSPSLSEGTDSSRYVLITTQISITFPGGPLSPF